MISMYVMIRRCFFAFYMHLITHEKRYARCLLWLIVKVDGLVRFQFLRGFARRQHSGFYLREEIRILKLTGGNVLDCGCGMGYWGLILKNRGCNVVGIDVFLPYLRLVKMLEAYDAMLKCSATVLPFRTNYFDTTLAIEVIEHLNKPDGLQLLRQAKQISNRVIVTTPKHYSSNRNLPSWVPKSEHHHSRWTERDFQQEGFTTTHLGQSILAITVKKERR